VRPGLHSAALALLLTLSSTVAAGAPPMPRQQELMHLLKHDCGSCHGLTMRGGLGSALVPARLQHMTVEGLAAVILDGVPGTPMPPWRPLLSEAEATWMAEQLKNGVPQ